MVAEEVIITLSGGAPWGFRLQGGVEHQKPLQVAKVRHVSQWVGQRKMFSWSSYFMVCWVESGNLCKIQQSPQREVKHQPRYINFRFKEPWKVEMEYWMPHRLVLGLDMSHHLVWEQSSCSALMIDWVTFKIQVQLGMWGNLVAYLLLSVASPIKQHRAQSSGKITVILIKSGCISELVCILFLGLLLINNLTLKWLLCSALSSNTYTL